MSALSFLTVFGRSTPLRPTAYRWFPVVGVAIGGVVGSAWWGSGALWHPLLAAILATALDVVVTGALHVDGLADSADGLLPPLAPERRLEVMRAPDVGAFGVIAVVLVILVRVGAIASSPIEFWMFPIAWATSRVIVAATPALVSAARTDSLGATFATGSSATLLLWLAPLTGVATMMGAVRGIALVVGVVAGSAATIMVARRRVGGWTGDVLGGAIVIGETIGLLIAVAQP